MVLWMVPKRFMPSSLPFRISCRLCAHIFPRFICACECEYLCLCAYEWENNDEYSKLFVMGKGKQLKHIEKWAIHPMCNQSYDWLQISHRIQLRGKLIFICFGKAWCDGDYWRWCRLWDKNFIHFFCFPLLLRHKVEYFVMQMHWIIFEG